MAAINKLELIQTFNILLTYLKQRVHDDLRMSTSTNQLQPTGHVEFA
jgi:hypothetical protein